MQELKVRTCHSPGSDRLGGLGVGAAPHWRWSVGATPAQCGLHPKCPCRGTNKVCGTNKSFHILISFLFLVLIILKLYCTPPSPPPPSSPPRPPRSTN